MMKKYLILLPLFLLVSLVSVAQNKIETVAFEVKGTCGQCKERIEEAVYKVKGVKNAEWNKKTKMITVAYVTGKTSLQAIKLAIANVGHDTQEIKAPLQTYNSLPNCCAYRDGKECAH
jgi:periplasmic mercuric ion binding protein